MRRGELYLVVADHVESPAGVFPVRVWVINGPNLGLLGRREPDVYGTTTLADLEHMLKEEARQLGVEVAFHQADGEGELIRAIHQAAENAEAVILNPGAYSHYSLALADAIRAVKVPVLEVHLTNVWAREAIRHQMVTAGACRGVIAGFGPQSYVLALRAAVEMAKR